MSDESVPDKITCDCGSILSNRPQALYVHSRGVKHKLHTGEITKEQYLEYREKQKSAYHSEELAEKKKQHKEKMLLYMRDRNTPNFLKAREEPSNFCEHCQCKVAYVSRFMHAKSKKHIYAMQGLPVPYRGKKNAAAPHAVI